MLRIHVETVPASCASLLRAVSSRVALHLILASLGRVGARTAAVQKWSLVGRAGAAPAACVCVCGGVAVLVEAQFQQYK